jgi:ribosome-interacting GTPase 1
MAAAKTADLILIMLDATKSEEQRRLLEIELDAVGIRLNKHKPDVVFKRRTTGGVSMNSLNKVFPDLCDISRLCLAHSKQTGIFVLAPLNIKKA